MKNNRNAFTLFELLAVLTITGVILMVALGSYNSWSSMHACTGVTYVIKAGLDQARSLAISKNQYIFFDYFTQTTNHMQSSSFQLFVGTNTTESSIESLADKLSGDIPLTDLESLWDSMGIIRAAPPVHLSKHVRISALDTLKGKDLQNNFDAVDDTLIFQPDGTLWKDSSIANQNYYIAIYTKRKFHGQPLKRFLKINYATGLVEIIIPEQRGARYN